jgi:hypothetical protein
MTETEPVRPVAGEDYWWGDDIVTAIAPYMGNLDVWVVEGSEDMGLVRAYVGDLRPL